MADYNPFTTGFIGGYVQQGNENRNNAFKEAERNDAKLAQDRKNLLDQFTADLNQAKNLMATVRDPQQKEAIRQVLAAMKEAYGGSYARQFGLDQTFMRQIDFALQQPSNSDMMVGEVQDKLAAINQLMEGGMSKQEAMAMLGVGTGRMTNDAMLMQNMTPEQKQTFLNTKAQGTYDEKQDKEQATLDTKSYGEAAADAQTAQFEKPRLENLMTQLNKLSPEAFGRLRGFWNGANAQAIKDDKEIGAAIDFLDEQKLNETMARVQQTKGAISDAEMGLFGAVAPGIGKNFDYVIFKVNMARAIVARNILRQKFLDSYKVKNGSLKGADIAWRRYVDSNPVGNEQQFLDPKYDPDKIINSTDWQAYLNNPLEGDSLPYTDTSPLNGIDETINPGPAMDAPVLPEEFQTTPSGVKYKVVQ